MNEADRARSGPLLEAQELQKLFSPCLGKSGWKHHWELFDLGIPNVKVRYYACALCQVTQTAEDYNRKLIAQTYAQLVFLKAKGKI